MGSSFIGGFLKGFQLSLLKRQLEVSSKLRGKDLIKLCEYCGNGYIKNYINITCKSCGAPIEIKVREDYINVWDGNILKD